MKLCCRCKIPLTDENGYRRKTGPLMGKLTSYCRKCKLGLNKEWESKNPDIVRKWHNNWAARNREALARYSRKNNHGLENKEYEALVFNQKDKCAICSKPFSIPSDRHVDHCHTTEKIRGLLCRGCNYGLGNFKDSLELLKSAEVYLKVSGKAPKLLGEGFACSM